MTFVTLWLPARTDAARHVPGAIASTHTTRARTSAPNESSVASSALVDALFGITPHVLVQREEHGGKLIWVDARGLPVRRVASDVLSTARAHLDAAMAATARLGASRVAIAAEIAARTGTRQVTGVAPRQERAFLATRPLRVLLDTRAWPATLHVAMMQSVVDALADAGIHRCGDLAALAPDAVAGRYGAAGSALWQLTRADDRRRLFVETRRALPSASIAWTTHELRNTERLTFVARRLVERIVDDVRSRGRAVRALVLGFSLARGGVHEVTVRGARPTCDVAVWSRLVRAALERAVLSEGVVGLALRAESLSTMPAIQGDLFDHGFQSSAVAERTIAELIDGGTGVPVRPSRGDHSLPERRVTQRPLEFHEAVGAARRQTAHAPAPEADAHVATRTSTTVIDLDGARTRRSAGVTPTPQTAPEPLALRILPKRRQIVVRTCARRGAIMPLRYREYSERRPDKPPVDVVTAFGPDRVATGHEVGEETHRTYWQCLTSDGRLVLLYQDGAAPDAWYLQGWWD